MAPPAHTSSAASRVKPPANTDSRRKSTRSSPVSRSWLHSMVARRVCWRVRAVRLPAARTSRLSPSRAAIWSSDSAATRAAASSMASGMPSSRRQISSMVASSSAFGLNCGSAAARSTNRRLASASDGTRQATSPSQCSGSRLVASTRTPGPARSRSSARRAQASMTCSQLSSTMIASRVARWAASASCAERCAGIGTPAASAVACATRPPSARPASSTNQMPSGTGSILASVSMARRVLPQPPGPMSVSSRTRASRRTISARSRSRPTNEVSGWGRLPLRLGGRLGGEQLAVEAARLGVGLGGQLRIELLAQELVLRQRLLAAPGGRVEAHERPVGGLGQRIHDERALEHGDRLRVVAVEVGELDAQGAVQLEQRGPARVGPRLVAILGQQLAGVEVERGLVGGGVAGRPRAGGGGLEGVDVDLGLEGDHAVVEAQGVGADRAPRGVQRLVEVVRRRVAVAVGPQQVGQALAVQPALGGEGQELDQRLGLAQAPRSLFDDAVLGRDREPAQQTHARYGVVHPRAPSVDEPTVSW